MLLIFFLLNVGPVGWQTSRVTSLVNQEPVNMHRKLQRQLTLNPACDPRLYQLRQFHQQHQNVMSSSLNNPQHRPLTRHTSNENYPAQLTYVLLKIIALIFSF